MICLADGDPAGALGAVREVLNGTAPVIGYVTVVEAHLLAGLASRALGDRRAADQSTERALALAEADRLVLRQTRRRGSLRGGLPCPRVAAPVCRPEDVALDPASVTGPYLAESKTAENR